MTMDTTRELVVGEKDGLSNRMVVSDLRSDMGTERRMAHFLDVRWQALEVTPQGPQVQSNPIQRSLIQRFRPGPSDSVSG